MSVETKKSTKSVFTVAAALALILLSVAGYFVSGAGYPRAPDSVAGALADTGVSANQVDRFSAYTDKKIILLRLYQKKARKVIKTDHKTPIQAMVASPFSRLMASADQSGKICIWDLTPLTKLFSRIKEPWARLAGNVFSVNAMAFSKDGTKLVVVGDDNSRVDVWDVKNRHLIQTKSGIRAPLDSFFLRVRFGPESESVKIRMAKAKPARQKERDAAVMRQGMPDAVVLRDMVSKIAIDTHGRPYSQSWGPSGRYLGYAQDEDVYIWKLCPNAQCRSQKQGNVVFLK